jgi:hypothetical protein
MTSLKTVALGLSLLITGAAPALAGGEQPHTAPVTPLFAGGYLTQDVGGERDPGFAISAAVPLRAGGQVMAASEAGGGFDPARSVIAGVAPDGTSRLAGGWLDRNV